MNTPVALATEGCEIFAEDWVNQPLAKRSAVRF
eukprot:SAG31_NODE_43666_length_266_cov_0.616766_1_plen_32_part_01